MPTGIPTGDGYCDGYVLPVSIDLPEAISYQDRNVPAVVYGSPALAASDIDPTSIRLGPNAVPPLSTSIQDENGDGMMDLKAIYWTARNFGLDCTMDSMTLNGSTSNGLEFEGSDTFLIQQCL